ncbi:ABC transporter, ATP-binding protein [Dictyocaulus viviparus]|uniref:ABC transporter, ATP-binding protein n=1 Tax=Dictyocaulus viviparus TaxID=29172 RepID=A0A0D8XXP0_DICVI|nr:ABC transporter, ATP-binding protein [Dictyocaulus viviparus]
MAINKIHLPYLVCVVYVCFKYVFSLRWIVATFNKLGRFPLLPFIARVFIPAFIGRVLANITLGGGMSALLRSVALMSLMYEYELLNCFTFSAIFGSFRGGAFTYAGVLVLRQIKLALFRSLIRQEIAFYDTTKSGKKLMVTFITVPVTAFITKWYGTYYELLSEMTQATTAESNSRAQEVLSSIRTVRSFACEMVETQRFEDSLDEILKTSRKNRPRGYSVDSCSLRNVFTGQLTADLLITFLLYQFQLAEYVYWISSVVTGIMECVGASRKVVNYIHRQPAMDYAGVEKPTLKGTIRFVDVYFTYPARPNNVVLRGLNLTIEAGLTTALVGPSGGGKSSIVSLIEHMYEPTSGSITIDDIPIQNIDHEYYHERIALVAQEPILYNCTIRENILYGCEWASEADMLEAAKKANVHDFVMELEKNYDTLCGDKGVQMSGKFPICLGIACGILTDLLHRIPLWKFHCGQKQRIAIARAMVRNPCILILDEATSALDADSENQIQEAINQQVFSWCAGRHTVLVIAHRLSTVERADTIAVIQHGTVVQVGTHKSLMDDRGGLYHSLVSKQFFSAIS